ncbi:hypothetical protein C3408_22235 [Candidatus Pantoea alvi]|nr:hypothetical protein C3408_22235 [Pantoea alvi]
MTDSTVITSVSYPDATTLALVADVQYHEPYSSAAINRKFRGILSPGFYSGFDPQPGGNLNLLITSADSTETTGAASVDVGDYYQITVRQQLDVTLSLSAGVSYAIILKAVYEQGTDTYQVNSSSATQAAQIYAKTYTDSYTLSDGELLICTVTIPAGSTAITASMIDTSDRVNQTIGISLSSDIDSDSTTVAANSLAVKKAIASLMGTAPDTLNTLALLAAAINDDPDFYDTINTALGKKMAIASNGADIADKSAFLTNLGLGEGSPVIGSPFPWPYDKMPNEIFTSMSGMVFLKSNGASFSGTLYPKLALAYPDLTLADLRGEFIRGFDDGRGIDRGRTLLSSQAATGISVTLGGFTGYSGIDIEDFETGNVHSSYAVYTATTTLSSTGTTYRRVHPRNIAFNYIVRAA